MGQLVLRNKKGFTLIEVLVSLVILVAGLLGSLIGVMAAVDYNLGNDLRTEAIKIAQEQLEIDRNNYAGVTNATWAVQRQVRLKPDFPFTVTQATAPVASSISSNRMRQVSITVSWVFKGKSHSYLLETILRQD